MNMLKMYFFLNFKTLEKPSELEGCKEKKKSLHLKEEKNMTPMYMQMEYFPEELLSSIFILSRSSLRMKTTVIITA